MPIPDSRPGGRWRAVTNVRIHPLWWPVAILFFAGLDSVFGPNIITSSVYVIPAVAAAYFSGQASGLFVALVLPAVGVVLSGEVHDRGWYAILNTFIRMGTLTIVALVTSRLVEHERRMARHLAMVEQLLPICMFCKNVRSQDNDWEPLERYVAKRAGTQITHGICPTCIDKHYPPGGGDPRR